MEQPYHFYDVDKGSAYGDGALAVFVKRHGAFSTTLICPYCNSRIESVASPGTWEITDGDDWIRRATDDDFLICLSCGWWRHNSRCWHYDDQFPYVHDEVAVFGSKLASLVPLVELECYLQKKLGDQVMLSAGRTEELVAALFKEHLDCEISYVSNGVFSPDGGIDFVLVNSAKGIEYAFQVKRRMTSKPERIAHVREFVGAVANTHYEHAFYVTTAESYTRAATKEMVDSPALNARRIALNLINGKDLRRLIRRHSGIPASINLLTEKFCLRRSIDSMEDVVEALRCRAAQGERDG